MLILETNNNSEHRIMGKKNKTQYNNIIIIERGNGSVGNKRFPDSAYYSFGEKVERRVGGH
jgi:hypothetical protein